MNDWRKQKFNVMYNKQFHHVSNTLTRERFLGPSMTEPDNAMSIPEIISRYVRGHGLAVQVLPDSSDISAREDGEIFQDDPDMYSEAYQASLAASQPSGETSELDKNLSSQE